MTPEELERACIAVHLAGGDRITLTFPPTGKRHASFPRGELLSVNAQGLRNYSVDPLKVLAWLRSQWTKEPLAQ